MKKLGLLAVIFSLALFQGSQACLPFRRFVSEFTPFLENDVYCSLPEPLSIEEIDPETQVFTSADPTTAVSSVHNDADGAFSAIRDVALAGSFSQVTFMVHGFTEAEEAYRMNQIKDNILQEHPDVIIVVFGWEKGAAILSEDGTIMQAYPPAAANTQPTGQYLGEIVQKLKGSGDTNALNIHIIGFSLGAHVAGKAGRISNGAVSRITGLDPAGPCFDVHNEELRLSKNDATFVDVYHTDGHPGGFSNVPYGTYHRMGHIDFYPHCGTRPQPPCSRIDDITGCSHNEAIDYYQWSVTNPGAFTTRSKIVGEIEWNRIDCVREEIAGPPAEMGYYADTAGTQTGAFYIEPNTEPPYGNFTFKWCKMSIEI